MRSRSFGSCSPRALISDRGCMTGGHVWRGTLWHRRKESLSCAGPVRPSFHAIIASRRRSTPRRGATTAHSMPSWMWCSTPSRNSRTKTSTLSRPTPRNGSCRRSAAHDCEILMHWPTALFIAAVALATAVELWLAARQIAAVESHRDRIPEPFVGQLSADDHRKAADYTAAKARVGMAGTVIDAALTLALTVGGGVAAIDALWRHTGWGEPWLGIAVIATVAAAVAVIGLPLSLVRTFRIEARFGFNRTTPLIFLSDLGKGLALAVLIGGPLILAVLALMDHAGRWWWLAAFGVWLAVTLLITWAWPAFIAPIFNKFSPVEDVSLKGRIEDLLARCGFRSSGVFVVDGS